MFEFNEKEFNFVLESRNISRKELCKRIGMNYSTMYRIIYIRYGDFRLSDINKMIKVLDMNKEEIKKVFINGSYNTGIYI